MSPKPQPGQQLEPQGAAAAPSQQGAAEENRQKTDDNWLFSKLSQAVLDSFSESQKQALHEAITDPKSGPPVNIRVTVPFWRRQFYLTVLSGQEKRSLLRRRHERAHYPIRTIANIFFAISFAVAFYAVALVALALFSSVLEV